MTVVDSAHCANQKSSVGGTTSSITLNLLLSELIDYSGNLITGKFLVMFRNSLSHQPHTIFSGITTFLDRVSHSIGAI